jgi:hypothetical protein
MSPNALRRGIHTRLSGSCRLDPFETGFSCLLAMASN